MKLKLTATIKKEALLPVPGMETAMQDVELQKELNKPGIVQQVTNLDQALTQLQGKYPNKGNWEGQDLITDLESVMEKSNIPFGIGAEEPNLLGDKMSQRTLAANWARTNLAWRQKQKEEKEQKEQKVKTVQTPNSKVETVEAVLSGIKPRIYFTHGDGTIYVLVY